MSGSDSTRPCSLAESALVVLGPEELFLGPAGLEPLPADVGQAAGVVGVLLAEREEVGEVDAAAFEHAHESSSSMRTLRSVDSRSPSMRRVSLRSSS